MAIRLRSTRVSLFLKSGTTILAALLLSLLLVPDSRAQSSGSTKWLATFDGTGASNGGNGASFDAIAADPQGNVYVTGGAAVSFNYCPPPVSCSQAVTIKYNSSGKALWKDWLSAENAFGSPLGTNGAVAQGIAIALDSSGNTYVLFKYTRARTAATGPDVYVPEVVVAKYNPAGGRDWIEFIDSSRQIGVTRTPVGMAISPAGDVYVLYEEDTSTNTSTVSDTVTVKYDTAGHFIWSQTIKDDTSNRPTAIALDAHENIYVEVGTNVSGEIAKFNASGTRVATIGRGQIGGAGNSGFPPAFHVDPDGACYFTGFAAAPPTPTSPGADSIVAKFNPDGSLAFAFDVTQQEGIGGFQAPLTGPNGGIGPITSDSAGNTFVLQRFDNTGTPHFDGNVISVLKLDPSGKEVFATRYNQNSDESGRDRPIALAVSSSGDVYVTGSNQPEFPAAEIDFVTLKYNNAGVLQWVEQYTNSAQDAAPAAMALSGETLAVTGTQSGTGVVPAGVTISYVP